MDEPKYKTHQSFFEAWGAAPVDLNRVEGAGYVQPFTVEEMYQHFKARFLDEYTPPGVLRTDLD